MKKRYELQIKHGHGLVWTKTAADRYFKSLRSKSECADYLEDGIYEYRVVQKLGRKVIKVVYPKGKLQ